MRTEMRNWAEQRRPFGNRRAAKTCPSSEVQPQPHSPAGQQFQCAGMAYWSASMALAIHSPLQHLPSLLRRYAHPLDPSHQSIHSSHCEQSAPLPRAAPIHAIDPLGLAVPTVRVVDCTFRRRRPAAMRHSSFWNHRHRFLRIKFQCPRAPQE